MKLLKLILGVFVRVWDWFQDPMRKKRRANAEVDKAIAEHDSTKINELLDKNLP